MNMYSYTFWIRGIPHSTLHLHNIQSAKKVDIPGRDFLDAFKTFLRTHSASSEMTINGLSNAERTLDLQGETITIRCISIKFINQITIVNGKLIIIPSNDCLLLRANLSNIKVCVDAGKNGKLIVSGSKCSEVVFIGDNIYFDGPVEGQFVLLDNKGQVRAPTDSKTRKQTAAASAKSIIIDAEESLKDNISSIPADMYQMLSEKLNTTDSKKILEAYKAYTQRK